jgi:hypothetical protein
MTTALIDPFTTNDFTEPIRAYASQLVQEKIANFLAEDTRWVSKEPGALEKMRDLIQEIPGLAPGEIRKSFSQPCLWDVASHIPVEVSMPANVTFEGDKIESSHGQVLAVCLGIQLGRVWPESTFKLTREEDWQGEGVKATTIRDKIKYTASLGGKCLSISAEAADIFIDGGPDGGWEYINEADVSIVGGSCWTSAGQALESARVVAVLQQGVTRSELIGTSRLQDTPYLEIDPDRANLVFLAGSYQYQLNATEVFGGNSGEALPQLVADGVFAELARSAGLEPTAKVGRREVGKVFAGL